MDSVQTERKAHYLHLAQDATMEGATDVCMKATSDPHLFVFSEILNAPKIAALQGTPGEKYHRLLRLFAYGVVSDFRANANGLPALSEAQWYKLRLLTLLTLTNGRSRIPYLQIQESLALDGGETAVEQLIRDAIEAGLIRARMDQRARVVEISTAVGRDVVTPDGVRNMADMLNSWLTRTEKLVDIIDDRIAFIGEQTVQAAQHNAAAAANAAAVRKKLSRGAHDPDMAALDTDNDFASIERQAPSSRHPVPRRSIRSRFEV